MISTAVRDAGLTSPGSSRVPERLLRGSGLFPRCWTAVMRLQPGTMWSGLAWLCLLKCCHSILSQGCDNGKVKLEMDLPWPDELLCAEPWPHAARRFADHSIKYLPQPAEPICMNRPIKYNSTIPSSGAHRPVGAMSGEYLYCPPQRWLKNLKDGAVVLLYHPCASDAVRRALAGIAHSCLADFVLTAHPQLSQHRPYALVSWGHTLEISHVTSSGVCEWLHSASSNLNLTKETQRPKYSLYLTKAAPEHRVLGTTVKSLRACCVEALSAFARTRTSREAGKPKVDNKDGVQLTENPSRDRSESRTLDSTHTLNITEDKGTVDPRATSRLRSSLETEVRTTTAGRKITTGPSEGRKLIQEKVLKTSEIDSKPHKKKKLHVQKHRIKTDVEEQAAGGSCEGQGQCVAPNTAAPKAGGPAQGRRMPVARTDEAVWAAAALGFLLVLLTLSVLHTRLYRNWRTPPSLYWHETQQDYESVADIIRRRLRMVGRRKRRASQSRRQECPLLPNSSTESD